MPVQVARRRANSRRGSRLGRREMRGRTANFNDELGGRQSLLATLEYADTSWCTLAGTVKKRDLERRLLACGWRFLRHGSRHDVWTDGEGEEYVPRHAEVNEQLARAILRKACKERI